MRKKHIKELTLWTGRWNPSEITLDDIFRCNLYCLETLACDPYTQRNGIIIIVDFEGHGLHHVRQLTPSYAKKFASLFIVCTTAL